MRSATWSAATAARTPALPRRAGLLTGSHYDTVRNGGKYDGRLGIFTPMACVRELARARAAAALRHRGGRLRRRRRPALQGHLPRLRRADRPLRSRWLDQKDADGITMREAMRHAGLPARWSDRAPEARPARYLGFVEVHIEQGPVLNELDLPLGIVTSINGGVRYLCEVIGMASHAGTTPMDRRRDAAVAWPNWRCSSSSARRATATRSAPSACSKCPTAPSTWCRAAASSRSTCARPTIRSATRWWPTCWPKLKEICERRGLRYTLEETMRAAAAPSAPAWQQRWERAVEALGLPLYRMPSGAGHDAMKLHEVMPQAMLFVRGQNSGISHNPLESTTSDDIELGVQAFRHLLDQLAERTLIHERPYPTRRLDRRPLRRGSALPAGTGARAHRHAARATTRRTPSAPPNC
jgi:N-carbamoyl-L-amino-acid hydrolase